MGNRKMKGNKWTFTNSVILGQCRVFEIKGHYSPIIYGPYDSKEQAQKELIKKLENRKDEITRLVNNIKTDHSG